MSWMLLHGGQKRPFCEAGKVKTELLQRPQMLEMTELWGTCQGELLKPYGTSQRERSVLRLTKLPVERLRTWSSEECIDIRHEDTDFGVCPAGFWSCVGPVFPYDALFPLFWNCFLGWETGPAIDLSHSFSRSLLFTGLCVFCGKYIAFQLSPVNDFLTAQAFL